MELGIVPLLDVFNLQHSIPVYINSLESLNADVGSELIHRPDYCSDKFIEINLVVAINVKHLESKYAMETMIAIIDFALTILFYSIIVWIIFTWIGSRMLERQFAERVVRDLDQERLIPLTVEVDQNQYFCYNSITKAFVCQGYSLKEIVEKFRQRYPNKAAAIYDGDETAVRTLKSQLKDLDENFGSIRPTP